MKKKLALVLLLFLSLFAFVGCSSDVPNREDLEGSGSSASDNNLILVDPTRKVIYSAEISIKTEELLKTTNEIKSKLVVGEDWIASENLTDDTNEIVFRVKATRLSDFINFLQTDYEYSHFKLDSKDVSRDYVDTQAKKEALEASRARLVALKAGATNYELIELEKRIAEIDSELNKLNSTLITYDDLVEYSVVKVYLHKKHVSPKPPSYGTTLSNSFSNGWNAALAVLKFGGQVIATLIPFMIIIVPIAGIVLLIVYRKKIKACWDKKKATKNKSTEEPVEEEKEE
ncbi:MAG: DUF4349 domain-containing protein [Acholeplasmataceae bacterium]|jgi:hypothetical protein